MIEQPKDEWEFLAAIANSPDITWEYKPEQAKAYYQHLLSQSRSGHLFFSTLLVKSSFFATTFLERFLSLDAEGQQKILEIFQEQQEKNADF